MATIAWPANDAAFRVAEMVRGSISARKVNPSSLNGSVQTVLLPGTRQKLRITWPKQSYLERARVGGLLAALKSGHNRLALHDFARPQPRYLAGSPTVSGAVGQFAESLSIAGTITPGYNLLARTQDFANAAWTKTTLNVTADATAAPDGTTTSDKLTESTTAATTHTAQQATATSFAAGELVAVSLYAKSSERTQIRVGALAAGAIAAIGAAIVDLSTGAVVSQTGLAGGPTITAAANGFWRVSITVQASSAGAVTAFARPCLAGTDSYAGTVGSGLFVWGAQAEKAETASAYSGLPKLEQGDWLSVPLSTGLTQLLRVTADTVGETLTAVPVQPSLRAGVSNGAAVTIIKPTALYVPAEPDSIEEPYAGRFMAPDVSVEFVEVFS